MCWIKNGQLPYDHLHPQNLPSVSISSDNNGGNNNPGNNNPDNNNPDNNNPGDMVTIPETITIPETW